MVLPSTYTHTHKKKQQSATACPLELPPGQGWENKETWMLRVANSTPIVDFDSRLNSLRVKRESRLDLFIYYS